MRAALVRKTWGPEVVEVLEVPLPEPGPPEVRVKVAAAALNPADSAVWAGFFGPMPEGSTTPVSGWKPPGRSTPSARVCSLRSAPR
ncbi:hypothetical protein AB0I51_16705 [Streptomyces sp. NPDC050549]|uniref:hypothetical protein n=1 Tax=Streptomyces sp. NPDC050549 TaxID=3155406 RepID=UPI00341CEE90